MGGIISRHGRPSAVENCWNFHFSWFPSGTGVLRCFHLVGELATGFGWKSESGNFRPIWMIPTPLESSWKSRLRMPHFQTSGKDFSAPKIQFEIQILLGQCNDRSILGEKNGNFACKFPIFESEKNFLAVSGSNCQVLPHQNPTEPWISWRIPRRRKNRLSSLKFKFSPFSLTIHCCEPKVWKKLVT